jgi:hypothetical protein
MEASMTDPVGWRVAARPWVVNRAAYHLKKRSTLSW